LLIRRKEDREVRRFDIMHDGLLPQHTMPFVLGSLENSSFIETDCVYFRHLNDRYGLDSQVELVRCVFGLDILFSFTEFKLSF